MNRKVAFIKKSWFTLIELLISISLLLILLTAWINSFWYFRSRSKLSESRNYLDSLIINANVNWLTWKSEWADFYWTTNSKLYQNSKCFLFIKSSSTWSIPTTIIYWELQTWIPKLVQKDNWLQDIVFDRNEFRSKYKLIYTSSYLLPFPTIISNLYFTIFTEQTPNKFSGNSDTNEISSVLIIFTNPFWKITFVKTEDLLVNRKIENEFIDYKYLTKITKSDLSQDLYLDFSNLIELKWELEFTIKYKDEQLAILWLKKNHFLTEYTKFSSKNELSHYWDLL